MRGRMEGMAASPVIVCLVSPEDYGEFRRVCVDQHTLPLDYGDYVKTTQELLESAASQGILAVKMYVKPAELVAWCWDRRRPVGSKARADYVAILYMNQVRDGR
jgi:hypothetical protein